MVIYIRDLVIEAKHGFHDYEKTKPQRFKINLELTIDNDLAGSSDRLEDTLNWSELRDKVVHVTQGQSFNLIEKLAKEIAEQLLLDKEINKIYITVEKLDAFPSGVPGIRLELENSKN